MQVVRLAEWQYLGNARTYECPVAVWRRAGKLYVANLDPEQPGEPLVGADGIPMGARLAPPGIKANELTDERRG